MTRAHRRFVPRSNGDLLKRTVIVFATAVIAATSVAHYAFAESWASTAPLAIGVGLAGVFAYRRQRS